jgi:F-type H+-transporting ATPase subunit a
MFTTDHHSTLWHPGAAWGYTAPWSAVDIDLVMRSAGVSIVLLGLCVLGRWALDHGAVSAGSHRSRRAIGYTIALLGVQELMQLIDQSVGRARMHQVGFIGMLGMYILLCNWSVLVGVHEPTADYNMTLALALTTFLWVQKEAIMSHGIMGYVCEFAKMPFSFKGWNIVGILTAPAVIIGNTAVALISTPLELVGKLSQILSLSFRLFGNIMAGSVVWGLWKSLWSYSLIARLIGLAGVNIVLLGFFGVFEGLIQAFVFTMLATTYLGIAQGSAEHAEQHV